jgi:hypothetical protein
MLGLFGIFGRSRDLQRLDRSLLGVGLDPRLVPEAVKLTTLKLLGGPGVDHLGRPLSAPDPARLCYRAECGRALRFADGLS